METKTSLGATVRGYGMTFVAGGLLGALLAGSYRKAEMPQSLPTPEAANPAPAVPIVAPQITVANKSTISSPRHLLLETAEQLYRQSEKQTESECEGKIDQLLAEAADDPYRIYKLHRLKGEISRDRYQNWQACAEHLRLALADLHRLQQIQLLAEMEVRSEIAEASLQVADGKKEALEQLQAVLDLEPESRLLYRDFKNDREWHDGIVAAYQSAATDIVLKFPSEELVQRKISVDPTVYGRMAAQSADWKAKLDESVTVELTTSHAWNVIARDRLKTLVKEDYLLREGELELLLGTLRFLDSIIDAPRGYDHLKSITPTPKPVSLNIPKLPGPLTPPKAPTSEK